MACEEETQMAKDDFAYVRCSTDGQTLEHQRQAVLDAIPQGMGKVSVLEEVWSGKDDKRPEYMKLKQLIRSGKCKSLHVWSIDRLGRNAREIRDFIDLCVDHEVRLVTIQEQLDLSSKWASVFIAIFATMAQLEWERISERTKATLNNYKAKGWKGHGSPPATAHILMPKVINKVDKIIRAHDSGLTIRDIARAFSCTEKTVMKIVHNPGVKWMTKAEWVKANPNWYQTPHEAIGCEPSPSWKARHAVLEE